MISTWKSLKRENGIKAKTVTKTNTSHNVISVHFRNNLPFVPQMQEHIHVGKTLKPSDCIQIKVMAIS